MLIAITLALVVVGACAFLLELRETPRATWPTLLAVSLLGGATGAYIAMKVRKGDRRGPLLRRSVAALALLQLASWLCVLGITVYAAGYSRATAEALAALESDGTVAVAHESDTYFFDGPGEDAALVFYPGGLVQTEAYAPLLRNVAEKGVDCFLVDMPYHLAFFGLGKAGDVMAGHDYGRWYLAGHSLGGVAAGSYAVANPDGVDGIAFLASYSTSPLPAGLDVLSMYGSNDGVLNMGAYDRARGNFPNGTAEVVIEGGNHAQFGNYGPQDGDGVAAITALEQQEVAASAIVGLCLSQA